MAHRMSRKLLFVILCQAISSATCSGIAFVTDLLDGSIVTGPIETLEFVTIPLADVGQPVAVDYDPVEGKFYWTDVMHNTINRAFVNGTGQEVVIQLSIPENPNADGIAIDAKNRHIYWTDAGADRIERANLDGTNRQIILNEGFNDPRAIVVDPAGQHLYWTDYGTNKIERANLDGTERKVIVDTNIQFPNGIHVRFEDQRLYWCDAGLNRIESTDLDGGDRVIHFSITNPDIHPFDIAIYKDTIYWTDWAIEKIVKLQLGSNNVEGVGPMFKRPGGLHIHQENDGSCSTNQCENGSRCRQLVSGYQCACLQGFNGTYCGIEIDECLSNPCLNDGQCTDAINRYICICAVGWTGVTCDEDVNECLEGACHVNADCTNIPGSFLCRCKTGFYEDTANSCAVIDNCNPQPCQNAGICTNRLNTFDCTCVNGFTGDICETAPPDPCIVYQPCRNDAPCMSTGNQYTCQCPSGFSGQNCDTEIDWCTSIPKPCYDNGICSSDINSFECACVNGFTGSRCEIVPPTTQPPGCRHPGNLGNGRVVPDKPTDVLYPPGKKVEFLCLDGYMLEGEGVSYCQLDSTWSHERPVCVETQKVAALSTPVVSGVGAVVAIVIVVLVVILSVVCFRKNRSASNELLNNRRNEPQLQKQEDHRVFVPTSRNSEYQVPNTDTSLYRSRISYIPAQSRVTINSIHIYDDIDDRRESCPTRLPPLTPTEQTTTCTYDVPPPYDALRKTDTQGTTSNPVSEVPTEKSDYEDMGQDNSCPTRLPRLTPTKQTTTHDVPPPYDTLRETDNQGKVPPVKSEYEALGQDNEGYTALKIKNNQD